MKVRCLRACSCAGEFDMQRLDEREFARERAEYLVTLGAVEIL